MRIITTKVFGEAELTCYLLSNSHLQQEDPYGIRPAVLVLPGGGYAFTSDREAEPVAMKFLAQGMQAFVLRYSVSVPFPRSLCETAEAIRLIRENAEEWHCDPNKIAVCGFSAGGHLAGSIAVFWHHAFLAERMGVSPEAYRPNAAILCYPVLSEAYMHEGSFRNLLFDQFEERKGDVSIEKRVDEKTVPCFLWHTFQDNAVPVQNSIVMMKALADHGVPFEAHIWPDGYHGLSLADDETGDGKGGCLSPRCVGWTELAAKWLRGL